MKRIIYILSFVFISYFSLAGENAFDMMSGTEVGVSYKSSQKELVVSMEENTPAYLEIYNILGSRVMVVSLTYENSRVNLSKLPDGQYIIKLSSTTGKLLTVKKIAVY